MKKRRARVRSRLVNGKSIGMTELMHRGKMGRSVMEERETESNGLQEMGRKKGEEGI